MARFWMRRSVCKEFACNGQSRVIAFGATYVLAYAHNALPGAEVCV
ncbi:Malolactic regulator [Lacticaseibacillus rhamnosus]|uniref:Malolactic regulator n=1 Tax=Lacticaseibacillus rhamnosus TaxID=47715 RepID=A0AAX0K2K3_LACRH|nr:Malolactic regulator [Lacticaseibacillus rhamnosus]